MLMTIIYNPILFDISPCKGCTVNWLKEGLIVDIHVYTLVKL